jgi:type I restriction enzyme S subunit
LNNSKEVFESHLQSVFENKGEDWEENKLEEICTKITDGVHKKPNYVSEGIPFIKINNLTAGPGISFENVSYISKEDHELFCKRTKPERGDILITKDGTIGIVKVVDTDIEFSIFVSVALIKPLSKDITKYLKYVLISPIIQNQIKPKGAALKHLYLKDLRKYIIPMPPIKKQKQIVKKLDNLSTETKKLEQIYNQKLGDLEELKKSILQKAFNGELTKGN